MYVDDEKRSGLEEGVLRSLRGRGRRTSLFHSEVFGNSSVVYPRGCNLDAILAGYVSQRRESSKHRIYFIVLIMVMLVVKKRFPSRSALYQMIRSIAL